MSELLTNEVLTTENDEEVTVYEMESEETSNGISGGLIVAGVAALGVAGVALYKKFKPTIKNAKDERKRRKLEKMANKLMESGDYVVCLADECEVQEMEFEDDSELIEESED